MGGVDLSDSFLSHYQTLKSIKWYRKLLLHLINMATLNAHILNKKYGRNKLSYSAYREYIADYLIMKVGVQHGGRLRSPSHGRNV